MSRTRAITKLVFLLAVLIGLFSVPLYQSQKALDELRARVTVEESTRYLPSGRFLSTAVLGFDNLTADLLWVRGIALFGERYRKSQNMAWYDWLFQLIDLATELDPLDVRIYKYGGLMLRLDPSRVDQSTYIFHKGMQHIEWEYFLPFGVAMNYLEQKGDKEHAAEYMLIAADRPNAPFYLRNLAVSLLNDDKKEEVALAFLEAELKELGPESLHRKAVEIKLVEVTHDLAARKLQHAFEDFLATYDRIPTPLEEMKGKTWSGPWPEDPYGGHFILDWKAQIIRSSRFEKAREEIRRRTGLGSAPKPSEDADAMAPSGPEPL